MSTDHNLHINQSTAYELFNKVSQLSAGDVVSFQSGFDDHIIHSVSVRSNCAFVHFDDPHGEPNPEHDVHGMEIAYPSDTGTYSPVATFGPWTSDYGIGLITDVTVNDLNDDTQEAVVTWKINSDFSCSSDSDSDDTDESTDPDEFTAHDEYEHSVTALTLPTQSLPDESESVHFTLVADNAGSVSIQGPSGSGTLGRIDMTQLEPVLRTQVERILNESVRDHHKKQSSFFTVDSDE